MHFVREMHTRHEETGAEAPRLLPPLCLMDLLSLLSTGHRPRDQLPEDRLMRTIQAAWERCRNITRIHQVRDPPFHKAVLAASVGGESKYTSGIALNNPLIFLT